MGKKINIENYEAFLLDLVEGVISDADRAELMIFLKEHPELDWDFEDLPELNLDSIELNAVEKLRLEKEEESGLSKLDHLLISELEKTIDKKELEVLDQLSKDHASIQEERSIYQKSILQKEELRFANKNALLKRETRVVPLWSYAAAVAAAILAFVLFNLPKEQSYEPRKKSFALVEPKVEERIPDYKIQEEVEKQNVDQEKIKVQPQIELSPKTTEPFDQDDRQLAENNSPQKDRAQELDSTVIPEMQVIDEEKIARIEEDIQDQEAESPTDSKSEEEDEKVLNSTTEKNTAPSPTKTLSPLEYARKVVKEDVLKNKTISETLMDEVADLTNEKVKLEKKNNDQFAFNLGKLKITKK